MNLIWGSGLFSSFLCFIKWQLKKYSYVLLYYMISTQRQKVDYHTRTWHTFKAIPNNIFICIASTFWCQYSCLSLPPRTSRVHVLSIIILQLHYTQQYSLYVAINRIQDNSTCIIWITSKYISTYSVCVYW